MAENGGPCPRCGEMHPWQKRDAYLEGTVPAKD